MKAIDLMSAVISRISSRADRSLSFSVQTPEMLPDQAAVMLSLHGVAVRVLIVPTEVAVTDQVTVKAEPGQKTPAQRLRGIIMAHWMQLPAEDKPDSEAFYRSRMETICENYKAKHLP